MVTTRHLNPFSRALGLPVFLLFTAILYAFFYNYHVLFVEQLRLFEWNGAYFNETIREPGGLSAYIGEFISQFYHWNHFGGLLIAIGIGGVCVAYERLLAHWGLPGSASWALFPAGALSLAFLSLDTSFGLIVGLLITFLFARITIRERSGWIRRALSLVGLPICYFLTGAGVFLYLGILLLDEALYSRDRRYGWWIVYGLLAILPPLLAYYRYDITETQAWIGTGCLLTGESLSGLYILAATLLLPPLLADWSKGMPWWGKRKVVFALDLLVCLAAIGLVVSHVKLKDERLYRLHHLTAHAQWDQVLKVMEEESSKNILLSSYANIALLNKHCLSQKQFQFYQTPHVNEFWSSNHLLNYLTAETYYQLDMLYAARAYMFMANTQTPLSRSPLYLRRLAEIEYRRGNAAASLKYVTLLESTLFYADWARDFRKAMNVSSTSTDDVPAYPENDSFLAKEMLYNVEQHWRQSGGDNPKVADFLLARYMLNNQYNAFIQLAKRTNLSLSGCEAYQEFLLMYAYLLKDNALIQDWGIGQPVLERFYRYLRINQSGKSDEEVKRLLEPYRDTYWYYVQYNKNTK